MRDRLVALINEAIDEYPTIPSVNCCKPTFAYYLADRFLKNGGIMPPCKVGDVAYHLTSNDTFEELNVAEIFEGKVCSISKDEKNLWIFCRYDNGLNFWYTEKDIGEKLFFVREEAEQALKGEHHAEIH